MTEAKIQHYVPKFLLRNFGVGKKDRVWVYDKLSGQAFQSNAKNVACENRFYNFEKEGEFFSLESSLSKIETQAKPVIDKILNTDSVSKIEVSDLGILACFLSIQFVRTKAFRSQWADLPKAIRENFESMGDEVAPGSQAEELTRQPSENQIKLEHARMLVDAPELYAPHFLDKSWFLARTTKSNPFILGDNPITLQNSIPMEPYSNIGLAVRGIEIYFPISATRAIGMWCPSVSQKFISSAEKIRGLPESLVAAHLKNPQGILEIDSALRGKSTLFYESKHVMNFNSLQVARSERYLFSSTNDFSLAEKMINTNPDLKFGPRYSVG